LIRLLIAGRFGNQLFQYAAARAQAKRLGVGLEIDLQFCARSPVGDSFAFWLDTLPIKARVISYPASGIGSANGLLQKSYRKIVRPIFWKRYVQPLWEQDSRFFAIEPWTIVSGYFQSLFYLMPRDEEILDELSFWSLATPKIKDFAASLARETSVSVHVRRGDAVINYGDRLPVWQAGHVDYFENAMRLMRSRIARPKFYIFSDDIAWCRQTPIFGNDCEFVTPNQFGDHPAIDLLIMSHCRHHIVTNSSYSWWAAWMTLDDDKICILPSKWTPNDTTAGLGLVYRNWITL
jgi:Glycosyl transferase family 11